MWSAAAQKKGSLPLLPRGDTRSTPFLQEHKRNQGKKQEKKILFVTKGMKGPPLKLLTSALHCSPVPLMR